MTGAGGSACPGLRGRFRRWRAVRAKHTTGRGHMQSAVRKTEARPPTPYPAWQAAVEPEARVFATSGSQSDGPAPPGRIAAGIGTAWAARPGLSVLCPRSGPHHQAGRRRKRREATPR